MPDLSAPALCGPRSSGGPWARQRTRTHSAPKAVQVDVLQSGMAEQHRKKPKVTLTLDPEVRAAADQLLTELPGKMSLSALVDELLRDFVTTVGPMVKQVIEASPLDRVNTLHQLAGQQMLSFGEEVAKTVHLAQLLADKPELVKGITEEDLARAVDAVRRSRE